MNLIESYEIEEAGFHPILIADSWQVVKLNYKDEYHINNLRCLKIHQKTDKAFALLHGNAVLITIDKGAKKGDFKVVQMERGISYNIPKNIRHDIVMEKGSEVLIVEKANTHINDVTYYRLNDEQLKLIKSNIDKKIKNNDE